MKVLALTITVILANVAGNLALDWGAKASGPQIVSKLLHPGTLLGIGLLIFWTLLKITLLSHLDLSVYLPVTSVGYVLTAVAAWLILGESISGRRWVGIGLITLGAACAGVSARPTSASTAERTRP